MTVIVILEIFMRKVNVLQMHLLQLGTLVPLAVEAAPLFTEEPRSSLEAANLVNTQPIQNDSPVVSDL